MADRSHHSRIARCGCGALTAEAQGAPMHVYLCSCKACQIKSGSAFTYAALFPVGDVVVRGEHTAWRHTGDSGRWIETHFCPTCGATVFFYSEGFTEAIGVPVGAFAEAAAANDPALTPRMMYWASRRHAWLTLPHGIDTEERQ